MAKATARGVGDKLRRARARHRRQCQVKVVERDDGRRDHRRCRHDGRAQPCAARATAEPPQRPTASDGADGVGGGLSAFACFCNYPKWKPPAPTDALQRQTVQMRNFFVRPSYASEARPSTHSHHTSDQDTRHERWDCLDHRLRGPRAHSTRQYRRPSRSPPQGPQVVRAFAAPSLA